MRLPFSCAYLLVLNIGVLACSCKASSGANNNSASTSSSSGATSSSSGGSSGSSSGANADAGTPEDPADTTPRVRYVGRVDNSDPAGPRLGWGGTRVIIRFRGDSVRIKINEHNIDSGPSGYDVIVDGAQRADAFVPADGASTNDLVTGLAANKEHTVELYRRTESMVATTQITGIEFPNGGELLAPPAFPNRRIEFFGDSESTGYGVECGSASESFTGATENDHKAYPSLVGRTLNAEVHNISYSGKGVSRNEDPNSKGLAVDFYVQSIAVNDSSAWAFGSWRPDVVWIALGGNDWDVGLSGDRPPPDPAEFKAKFNQLLDLVRAKNPSAQIVCAVQGMLNDVYPPGYNAYTNDKTVIKQIVDERNAAGDTKVQYHEHPRSKDSDLTGCDSHPNAAYHEKLAASVGARIQGLMNWQ